MKTLTIKLYSFDELSKDAQQTAIENFRETNYEDSFLTDEATETLNKFCDIFSIEWSNFDYCEMYRSEWKFNFEDHILQLTGQRLATYIWNNFRLDLYKGKWYFKGWDSKKRVLDCSKGNATRHSKITLERSCVLTGVCYDEDILAPIYQFIDKPNNRIDFEDLLKDCLHSLAHSVCSEIEYQNSDEAITETILANEYDFTEDGEMN